MKLKLDLHPIYSDSARIEASLQAIIEEAIRIRATEVEIIPGKGSGALKKSVLRFLDRPEIKARYHRIEKDGDNWGRLFVHFRFERSEDPRKAPVAHESASYTCFCCLASVSVPVHREDLQDAGSEVRLVECPSCGSPNRLLLRAGRSGPVQVTAEPGYPDS